MLTFQLSFHFPYYAWRAYDSPRPPLEDSRRFLGSDDDTPLRGSEDVSFLNDSVLEGSHYLYQSQMSLTITGSDSWRWTAYFFVDTYHDHESRETVQEYHEEAVGEGGFLMDPLTLGTVAADQPLCDPRAYFLLITHIRLNQVKLEWQTIEDRICRAVRACHQVCMFVASHNVARDQNTPTNAVETNPSDRPQLFVGGRHRRPV